MKMQTLGGSYAYRQCKSDFEWLLPTTPVQLLSVVSISHLNAQRKITENESNIKPSPFSWLYNSRSKSNLHFH